MKLRVWVDLGSCYNERIIDIPDEEVADLSEQRRLQLFCSHVDVLLHNSVSTGYDILEDVACSSPEIPVYST